MLVAYIPNNILLLYHFYSSSRGCNVNDHCIHPELLKLHKNMAEASDLLSKSRSMAETSAGNSDQFFSLASIPSLTELHLVVGGALGYAIVYSCITKEGNLCCSACMIHCDAFVELIVS